MNAAFPSDSAVAIIGMAGRFPGAESIEAFWRNLRDGVESISLLTDADLDAAGVEPRRRLDPRYVRAASVLAGIDLFDAAFFEMHARDAQITDPQHRLFLECAWHALEDAGCDPARFSGEIGVFAGAGRNTYFLRNISGNEGLRESLEDYQIIIGSEDDYLATRVAFKLNLRGPAVTVQTACSTSLVAIHMACRSLLSGECQMALAGGVSIKVPQRAGYLYKDSGMYSPDGHTRPFDSDACGTVFGSGVGVVALKPLNAALAAGDPIRAVIKGSAVNNDGASKAGYTAPSAAGQAAAIRKALASGQVDSATIAYVEAHGTGTLKGDPVEMEAIRRILGAGRDSSFPCLVGSVKGNVGHLDAAAGVTGLIKTILALENEEIPGTVNFRTPHPACGLEQGPFRASSRSTAWKRSSRPRRAGVTSLGFGGTNAHVVVEEAPPARSEGSRRPWHLLVISAKTESALESRTRDLVRHLGMNPRLDLAGLAATLQTGRTHFPWRRFAVCRGTEDAIAALESGDEEFTSFFDGSRRPVAFLFPGHGSHEVNMTRGLYETEPAFRRAFDEGCDRFAGGFGVDFREILFPSPEHEAGSAERLTKAFFIQSALFVTSYALAMLWKGWGVEPDAVAGYSIGEVVAAAVAGVISLDEAVRMTGERSRMMQELPAGEMTAVALGEEEVRGLMNPDLDIGAVNGPEHTTVSGPSEAMDDFKRRLEESRIAYKAIRVPHAYHSRRMDPMLGRYRQLAGTLAFRPPRVPFVSTVTGSVASDVELCDPDYWVREARQTIRFSPAVASLAAEPDRIFLEVGPGQLLSKLVQSHPSIGGGHLVLSSCPDARRPAPEERFVLTTLGRLWLAGRFVNWAEVYSGERPSRVPLPGYPFERQRYWIEAPKSAKESPAGQRKLAFDEWTSAGQTSAPQPPEARRSRARRAINGPRDELEEKIAGLWRQVLGIAEVDIAESFLELGGNSLVAVQLISRVRDVFGKDLAVGEFLRAPTVMAMAESIRLAEPRNGEVGVIEDVLSEIEAMEATHAEQLLAREQDRFSRRAEDGGGVSPIRFSLFFFSGDEAAFPSDKYRLVIESARHADANGFEAVWTPERHFHRFGGLYPNPAVLGAALAATTQRLHIRAGSVIAPLQNPIRVAEEWAVVDNLSHGRTGIAFATGFHPVDFLLSPDCFSERSQIAIATVEEVRRFWRGERVRGKTGTGEHVERLLFPRPVQPELPVWLTATRSTETFIQAGRMGVNVLTALLRISPEEMAEKIAAYREARRDAGHDPEAGTVTLMIHAFVGPDDEFARRTVSGPFRAYLGSHLEFLNSAGTPLSAASERELIATAYQRFQDSASLFGAPESCLVTVEKLAAIGVNELACLIDFGIDFETTLSGLDHLARLAGLVRDRRVVPGGWNSQPGLVASQ